MLFHNFRDGPFDIQEAGIFLREDFFLLFAKTAIVFLKEYPRKVFCSKIIMFLSFINDGYLAKNKVFLQQYKPLTQLNIK